jgi:hypothetical protein
MEKRGSVMTILVIGANSHNCAMPYRIEMKARELFGKYITALSE